MHTPGPWEIESPTMAGDHRIVIGAYGFGSIAAVSRDGAPRHQDRLPADSAYHQDQIPTMESNAHLIAAAPDLLSACKNAEMFLGEIKELYPEICADGILSILKAAIAKAEGK